MKIYFSFIKIFVLIDTGMTLICLLVELLNGNLTKQLLDQHLHVSLEFNFIILNMATDSISNMEMRLVLLHLVSGFCFHLEILFSNLIDLLI